MSSGVPVSYLAVQPEFVAASFQTCQNVATVLEAAESKCNNHGPALHCGSGGLGGLVKVHKGEKNVLFHRNMFGDGVLADSEDGT